jgi:hypothetical protein
MSDLSLECARKRISADSHESMGFVLLLFNPRVEGTIARPSQSVRRRSKETCVQGRRSVAGVGVAKSLARAGAGPVVLLHIKKRSTSIEKTQLGAALHDWLCRGARPMSLSYLRCTRLSPITCASPVSVILRLSLCKTPCAECFLEKPGHSVRQTQIGACNFRTATNKTLVLPTSAVPSTSASPSE